MRLPVRYMQKREPQAKLCTVMAACGKKSSVFADLSVTSKSNKLQHEVDRCILAGLAVAALGGECTACWCLICSAVLNASLSAAQIVLAIAPGQTLAVLGL